MASIHKRGGRYVVRYRDLGGRERGYTPPAGTRRAALRIRREIDECHARGQDWVSPTARARRAPTLEAGLTAFVDARRPMVSAGYLRQIQYALGGLVQSIDDSDGERSHPVSVLSKSRLTRYFAWLREVRGVSHETARERVRHVERAWVWLADDDEWGPRVSRSRKLELPRGVRAMGQDAPSWAQMDAAINAARGTGDWMWRLMFLASRTGLRGRSQILRLKWSDVDLRRQVLRIRPELGKSRRERRGRTVPLAPVVVDIISGWARDGEWLVRMRGQKRHPDFARMPGFWAAAELDPQALPWQPLHGFRKGFVSAMARAGVQERVACFLTGHHRPGDVHTVVYTASDTLLELARDAVAKLPPLADLPVPPPAAPRPIPAGIVVPTDGRIDWNAQPLGQMSDVALADALTRSGAPVSRAAVRYHRACRGIPPFPGPTLPKGIDWERIDWASFAGMSLAEIGAKLGVSPQEAGRRRRLARARPRGEGSERA